MTELKSVVWSVFICRHQSQRAEHRKHDEVRTWAWTRTRTRTSSGGSDVFSSSQLMTSCWCHSAVTLAVWGEPQWAHSDCGVLISVLSSVWQARRLSVTRMSSGLIGWWLHLTRHLQRTLHLSARRLKLLRMSTCVESESTRPSLTHRTSHLFCGHRADLTSC